MLYSCDVCGKDEEEPERGYILGTSEIVSEPRYWRHYFEANKRVTAELTGIQIRSFEEFVQSHWGKKTVDDVTRIKSPWLLCEDCIDLFDSVDRAKARARFQTWRTTGVAPETGTASLSEVRLR